MGDRSGKTPLHHAAYMGHTEMIALLLVKGANVKAADKKERTALHFASIMGERSGGVVPHTSPYSLKLIITQSPTPKTGTSGAQN